MPNYLKHGRQILLEGSVRILSEPFRGQPLGCDSFRTGTVDLGFDFEDKVGQGGQAGDSIFERETRPHREYAELNLLEIKSGEGSSHGRTKFYRIKFI